MKFEMVRFSQFGNLTQVTVRTLHHYDEIGLLLPTVQDLDIFYWTIIFHLSLTQRETS
jgi:hypothetical protein